MVVWGLIQTRPRKLRNHKTTSQQATAPHLKTEYQMKQTPVLPCLHHSNCLGESIWWIMKRFFFPFFSSLSLYNSLLLALLVSLSVFSLSFSHFPFFMLFLMNSSVPPPLLSPLLQYTSTSLILLLSSSSFFLSLLFPPFFYFLHLYLFSILPSLPPSLPNCLSLFNVHNSVLFRREPWRYLWQPDC